MSENDDHALHPAHRTPHLVSSIGFHLVSKRIYQSSQIKDFRSFLAALGKDWWLVLLVLWSLVSTALFCFMIHQVWREVKSPFKTLGLDASATEKDAKRAYRHLSLTCHPD
jgi:preprotein translocase subunit Sec63